MSISENYAKRSAKPTYLPSKASAINSRLSVVPNRFYQRIKVFLRHLMPDVFRFKRFDVDQEGCAMKINTDGVLLGATATINRPARILDIGTGTGVIALMLAQRYPSARITAIEIDPEAANTADKNFKASPFSANLNCQAVGLQHFETRQQFDLIVSNPPYFLHSLTSKDDRNRLARHTEVSFFDTLLMKA